MFHVHLFGFTEMKCYVCMYVCIPTDDIMMILYNSFSRKKNSYVGQEITRLLENLKVCYHRQADNTAMKVPDEIGSGQTR
jgi:hypothetical protein